MTMTTCLNYSTYDAGRANLLVPKEVEEFAKAYADEGWEAYNNKTMCKWIEPINWNEGIILERTFAIHRMKNDTVDITECARRLPNQPTVISNAYWYGFGGWVFNRGNVWDKDDFWYAYKKKSCRFYGKILNQDEIINNFAPYCCYEIIKKETNLQFFEYLEIYLRNPKSVELLVKNGYATLVTCTRYLNFKARNIADCLKVKNKWVEYLKGKHLNHLLACRKDYVHTVADADLVADIMYFKPAAWCLNFAKGHELQMCHYLQRIDFTCNHDNLEQYRDYLRFAEEIGLPMDRKETLFPIDWREAHDEAYKQVFVIRNKEKDDKIRAVHDELTRYSFEENRLLIRPAATSEELLEESKVLEHCVRTYVDKVAERQTSIFFIRLKSAPEKPYVTLELKDRRVVQYHGYKNDREFPITTEVHQFISDWKKEFQLM